MEKGKKSKRKILYCIPLFLQLIIHIVASSGITQYVSDINNALLRLLAGVIIAGFSLSMGEGYGSIAFIVAGFYNHIVAYVVVIILSMIGIGANFAGYMLTGIEGNQCLWLTVVFWGIDLFLIIFSIVRIVQLASKRTK